MGEIATWAAVRAGGGEAMPRASIAAPPPGRANAEATHRVHLFRLRR